MIEFKNDDGTDCATCHECGSIMVKTPKGEKCSNCGARYMKPPAEITREVIARWHEGDPFSDVLDRGIDAAISQERAQGHSLRHYLSTACLHFKHDQCRKQCKFCNEVCWCDCHRVTP